MEKNENSRLKMLGLLTKEENCLVLYDALSTKDFARFSYFIDKGYAINAFILNCMIDFGFEDKISEVLKSAQRHDDNIYEFMVAYLGQEKAEAFFVGNNFNNLMANKFSDETIEKHKCWKVALIKKNYNLLLRNRQLKIIKENLKNCDWTNLVDALIKVREYALVVEMGGAWKLRESFSGRQYLRGTKNWNELLRFDEYSLMLLFECKMIDDVYDKMLAEGATDSFYNYSDVTKEYLLKSGITAPFIEAKDWCSLYHAGYYREINLEDWWTENTSDVVIKAVIKTAINAKNWDFLEQRKCLWALFKNFRWQRIYRIWRS